MKLKKKHKTSLNSLHYDSSNDISELKIEKILSSKCIKAPVVPETNKTKPKHKMQLIYTNSIDYRMID